ncbi:hypothetical protein BVX97_03935 [bacterium E08(2017)]|nr:hypothetical protein BVX97_03935 [bacterium E08(2017)]
MREDKVPYKNTVFDLSGKVALVSGGAGLLGSHFCKALLDAGAWVVMADNDREALAKSSRGLDMSTAVLDVTDEGSVSACVFGVIAEHGTIDILVNLAAMDPMADESLNETGFSKFPEFKRTRWQEYMDVNLTGTFLLTQKVCSVMEKTGKGSIITVGSNYGLVRSDQRTYKNKDEGEKLYEPVAHSVCNAGIVGFTKYLAEYYAGTQIRANVLTPSAVFNDHNKMLSDEYASKTLLGRRARNDEFNGGLLFLASDASSYMTGGNLVIDGGWSTL